MKFQKAFRHNIYVEGKESKFMFPEKEIKNLQAVSLVFILFFVPRMLRIKFKMIIEFSKTLMEKRQLDFQLDFQLFPTEILLKSRKS